jgi:hypothetical protein
MAVEPHLPSALFTTNKAIKTEIEGAALSSTAGEVGTTAWRELAIGELLFDLIASLRRDLTEFAVGTTKLITSTSNKTSLPAEFRIRD